MVTLALLTNCASATAGNPGDAARAGTGAPPAGLLGAFDDDYAAGPTITATRWEQGTGTVYLPVVWYTANEYVIARNAPGNTTAPGRFTRIDWMPLAGNAPYQWAYCLSVFDAPTADSAAAVRIADRANPRTGCNGFPFTRLKPRVPPLRELRVGP